MRRLLLLLCLAAFTSLSAQRSLADSARRALASLDPGSSTYLSQKAGALGTLLQSLKYSDPAQSLLLCDTLHDVFMEMKDTVRAYEAKYRYKAGIYELRGESDSMLLSLETYAEALASIHRSDGYVYLDIGNVYFSFGMFKLATENYNRAEQIFREAGILQGLCTIYNNHAQMYMATNDLLADSALMWLRKSYRVRMHELKDPILAHETMYLMAVVYRRNLEYDSARLFYWQIISDIETGAVDKHTDRIALRQEFAGAYTSMGSMYSADGNRDSAEYYFRKGEKLYLESGYNNRLPGLYNVWCRMYIKLGDKQQSWSYLKKSESYSSINNPSDAMSLYQLYGDWYEWQGQAGEMYKYRMLYYRISDSLQASGSKEQTMVVASRVLQLQDQARIDQQRAELAQRDLEAVQSERKRVRLILIAIALLLLVTIAAWSVVQLRKKNAIIGKYNRDLEAANATKEQFLSVISHDLRSPFNALIGMSDLLREQAKAGNFTHVEQNADHINEASRKAFVLLDNLMQWVSIQKDNIVVKKEIVAADDVVEEVLFLLQEQSLGRNMTIEKHVCVAKLKTDKTLLQVVLRNLISNAVKYTPVGGTIRVTCEVVKGALHLVVEDNGRGFPEAELATMMSRQQGMGTAKKAGGLGLVLVRQFVQLLGGTITAGNMKGSGARVTVVLPDAVVAGESTPHVAASANTVATHLVLSAEEKQLLSPLVKALAPYELFDATEIRELAEKPVEGETENIRGWRKSLLQSVYLADENKYAELMDSARV